MTPAVRLLEQHGVPFGLHEYDRGDEARDFGREAAAELGLDEDEVFKTLLVDVAGGRSSGDPVVAVVPVSCSVSMKAVAGSVGAKRATMCDPAQASRLTGYVVGGISPLGQRRRLITVVDETATLFDRIYVSGGRRGLDVSLRPTDLVALLGAIVADIAVLRGS
ncbi:MAG: Cys-tRNA(Pro) deacylase [Actinomycetota bacterium]